MPLAGRISTASSPLPTLEKIALPLGRRAMKTGYCGGLIKKTSGHPANIPCFAELTEFCYYSGKLTDGTYC
jgi:hypothetical protein